MSDRAGAGDVVLERWASFEPELDSAGAARRLVREALGEAGRDDWLDAGELAISEVVTNAALHAHTPIDVHVGVHQDRLCVEVRDYNPVLPVQRHYEDEATTGRGMALIAAIALECGVESLGESGKITWFSVGDAPEPSADALLATWEVEENRAAETSVPSVSVTFASMPTTLWLAARQHHDALLRELVLYLAEHDDVTVDLPAADAARGIICAAVVKAVEEASAAGAAPPAVPDGHRSPLPWTPRDMTIEVSVPAGASASYAALQDTLDAAEALAASGRLFVRPGLPEIIAVRDWACEQVIAQLAQAGPAPWPGTADERFEVAVHDRTDPGALHWDESVVFESDRGVVAADDANRIVAVSRPLADLLGWEVGDLVGRRVVTIIPPSLREAHVAGFSRHLSSGESHILGVDLRLPVLRADGTEIDCEYLVEQAGGTTGRAVYLAWVTPVP